MKSSGALPLPLSFLVWILAAVPVSGQNSPLSPTGGVVLSLSYVPGAGPGPSLRLELINKNAQSVTLLTGVMTGSTAHPAAAFRFFLELPDQHQLQLYCTNPSCEPWVIAGSVGPYTVSLLPDKAFHVDIPLSDLRTIDGDREVGAVPATLGSRLIVRFIGEPALLKATNADSQGHVPYWAGTASQKIPLMLKLVP